MQDQLGGPQRQALAHVASSASGESLDPNLRVTVNFHPDRWLAGLPILESLARDGIYRSQFETGSSNGGLTAHPGGDRWRWESRIFGGAYDDAAPTERPKYVALNYRKRRAGASPRFGSAHLRLTGEVVTRSTFCFPDSVFEPVHFRVAAKMSMIERRSAADAGHRHTSEGSARRSRSAAAATNTTAEPGPPTVGVRHGVPYAVRRGCAGRTLRLSGHPGNRRCADGRAVGVADR